MSILVEDGSIVTGAESYATVTEANTYHTNRNNALWTGTDTVKEAALRKAAAYLDGKYRKRWKGCRVDALTQPMEWPRANVLYEDNGEQLTYSSYLPITTIPQRLKDAQCELALRSLSGDLAVDGETNIISKKVDAIQTQFVPGAVRGQKTYQIVDQLLSDLLHPVGGGDVMRG